MSKVYAQPLGERENQMGKISNLVIGIALGTAVGVVVNYLFGPARDTSLNEHYRSRWDRAIEEGQQAAEEREAELRREFAEAKRIQG
jgi:hypothetical protein